MKSFVEIAEDTALLVSEKNQAYGDSFRTCGEFLKILYPEGIAPEQYGDALAIVRIFDKMKRIATKKDAFGEDPWKDILGYAILAVHRNQTEVIAQ